MCVVFLPNMVEREEADLKKHKGVLSIQCCEFKITISTSLPF